MDFAEHLPQTLMTVRRIRRLLRHMFLLGSMKDGSPKTPLAKRRLWRDVGVTQKALG
jgi:hypothetical protein